MEEELTIEELYTEDLDELSQEEDNVIEEPADDPQIPTEDQDSGEGGEQLPIEVATIDEVEPDEEDVINPEEENDLTEPEVAAEEHTPQPLVSNELTLPTIGSVTQGQRVMIALVNGEPTVLGTVGSGDATNLRISTIEADYIKTAQLDAEKARITNLEANKADVTDLTAANAAISNLQANKANVSDLNAATADIASLKTGKADVSALNVTNANVTALQAGKADVDLANVTAAWVENGTIANGAITNAMIHDVSANKLTAGTIDASNITVTNLNASNITTGTINGQRIGQGSLSLDKLSESVYTQGQVDDIAEDLQDQILAQIETWTGSAVPTLNNYPASNWTTADVKHNHVGDVYYVINPALTQDGYCYRFAEGDNSTYSWVLIKDSDVTKALRELVDVKGDIGEIQTFDTTVSSYMSNTTDELNSTKTRTTNLETRMGTAETNISNKVNTSTFNTLKQTVDENSASITTLTSTTEDLRTDVDGKASQSSVTTLSNTVNTVSQKADSNSSKITNLTTTVSTKANQSDLTALSNTVDGKADQSDLDTLSNTVDGKADQADLDTLSNTVAGKADTTTVTTLTNRVSAAEQDLSGFKTTVSTTYATKTALNTTNANVTAAQTAADNANSKIDNLSIGGRNYIRGSADMDEEKEGWLYIYPYSDYPDEHGYAIINGSSSHWNAKIGTPLIDVKLFDGDYVRVSFDYKADVDTLVYIDIDGCADDPSEANQNHRTKYRTTNYTFPAAAEWTRYEWPLTLRIPDDLTSGSGDVLSIYVAIWNRTDNSTLQIRHMKLEKGTKATDWTPAPEDVASSAEVTTLSSTVSTHTTQLQQHDTAISAKANASDVYTKTQTDGLISTEVTNRNAAITASANSINSSVSANYTLKSTTEALDGRVTENTTALEDKADAKDVYSKEQIDNSITEITAAYQSEINEAADQITQSVSETYADKDSVRDLNTLITETASSWNLQITDLSAALNDAVDSLGITDGDLKELTTYVHIENEGTSPCLSLGSSESNITAALLNNRLEFRVKGSSTPVAYIEVNENTHVGKLYITSAVVTSEMQFGYWKWFARSNDNLALKWIGA